MVEPRELTEQQIERLVNRVIAGGAGTLERAVHEALWPDGDCPENWGGWPKQAIAVWDRCVSIWIKASMREFGGGGRHGTRRGR